MRGRERMSIADDMDVTTLRAEFTRILNELADTEQQLEDALAATQRVRELTDRLFEDNYVRAIALLYKEALDGSHA